MRRMIRFHSAVSTMWAMPTRKKTTAARRPARPRKEERVAVITGGSRGIGRALASEFAARGYTVLITGRDEAALAEAAASIAKGGATVLTRHCDVRSPESVGRLFVALETRFKHVDVLVNNAGIAGPNATVDKLKVEAWLEVVATNLNGTFLVTKAALPLLRSGSTIVNNLSAAARQVFPGMPAYIASKHGALGFTNALREELRPRGIRVLGLLPGATATDIWDQFWPDAPRARMMSPQTIARAVADAVELPDNASVDELVLSPTAGAL